MSEDVWHVLPADVREAVDAQVLRDAFMQAVHVLFKRGVRLNEAQEIVGDRYRHHGDRVARRPEPPLGLPALADRAAEAPGRVVEIAAEWDGDTVHDWFVDLVAVTADPAGTHPLTTVTWSAARRYLDGEETGTRRPAAVVAERIGTGLAARLAVPFRFDHPDEPDRQDPGQPNTR
ncbi:hypothetical protein [Streptomyces sp. VRA16 Mangrove soil]|uniref:hypothetical protein n=1 Tax=Streptomyces sp. VRA16 Mangrove soil TaxID=2817434 RepID=UPI001A9F87AD|nr:hypothetical protein [Streptomyces sp. VRA16 Mangrove soil]MBO1332076.1 hypothetical protein [Streptomyces sp. VRA16 Mangrove soil]